MPARKPYPSDVTDDEWAFAGPYLARACPHRHGEPVGYAWPGTRGAA